MKHYYLTCIIIILFSSASVQSEENGLPKQTIKGFVTDQQTHQPIAGATISVKDTNLGAYTKVDGTFKVISVPVGRKTIRISALGYEPQLFNIVLTSGAEQILNIELTLSYISKDTVFVSARKDNFESINESALVSSTAFTVDDVNRFAGSKMDVARMASNFAGVMFSSDQRNDIIVRGGSPLELLCRIDGLDIPNPNHFATQGATGGPISALNHNLIDNSDFLTGAFPSEYGGKMSGVFDIHTRRGNDEKYEFIGEFGFNGFELGAQGPLPVVKGSFIVDYRYSFLDLLEKMGVNFGFAGIPRYQDLTIKSDIDLGNNDKISISGLFGTSSIDIRMSDVDTVFTGDNNILNGSDLATFGISWQHLYSNNLFGKLLIGGVYENYHTFVDSITTDNNSKVLNITPWFKNSSSENYITAKYNMNWTLDKRNFISFGAESRLNLYNINEQRFTMRDTDTIPWLLNKKGNSLQTLSFINWNYRLTEEITTDMGIHSQYLQISNKMTFEPRVSISWNFLPLQKFTAGFGIHNQMLPLSTYFYNVNNEKLDFMKATHYVVGYSYQLTSDALVKVESYYKNYSNVPVEKKSSSFSMLNSGATFGGIGGQGVEYISEGVGKSYGAEFSLIKNFSNGYYITATGSYIRQQYAGSDKIWRFGAFDNIFVVNLLAGYEFQLDKRTTMGISIKYTNAGGTPYTPLDMEKSRMYKSTYYDDTQAFTLRNKNYSKLDTRFDFRMNFEKFAVISFFSFENLLVTKNDLYRMYNAKRDQEQLVNQIGFFFVGGFKIEF